VNDVTLGFPLTYTGATFAFREQVGNDDDDVEITLTKISAKSVFTVRLHVMQRTLLRRLFCPSVRLSDFGTNRKLIYDFPLVINSNLPPILHHFQVMADYWSNFR